TFETWVGIDITAGSNGYARFRVGDVAGKSNLVDAALARVNRQHPQLNALAGRVATNWAQKDQTKALRELAATLTGELGALGRQSAPRFGEASEPVALLGLLAELWTAKGKIEQVASEFARVNLPALRRAVRDLTRTFPKEYTNGPAYLKRLDSIPVGLAERLAKYDASAIPAAKEIAAFSTKALLENPLLDFDQLLLVRRKANNLGLPANWQSNSMLRKNGYGNDLAVLSPVRPGGKITTLYRPADDGFVGDVDLHPDGDRVLFSKSDPKGPWQVYEYGLAGGTPPQQVSPEAEPFINNYDACYLPDGDILYTSTAAMVAVPCVYGGAPVAHLFRLDRETGASRQISFDQEHAWCPTVLNNGRILYLRWEYADLPHANSRILFHCNPDGTSQMEYYGSNSYWPNGVFYARPIPGLASQVVGIVSGHHGVRRMGELVVFDPARGRREASGVVQRIPGFGQPVEAICADRLADKSWPHFMHPFPLGREDGRGSGKYFLVSAQPSSKHKWGVYLADSFDNMTLLAQQPGMAMLEPIPLRKTSAPPVIPERIDLKRKDGLVYLSDIYRGGGLKGIPRGAVKSLRLFTYTYGYRGFGGLYGSIGMDGPWDCRRILGTVPVESDGSAFFRVPANVPVAVQPLDKEGKAVQLMRSWFTAMPGETISCVGCHEAQNNTPPAKLTLAARKAPTDLSDWRGKTRNFGFAREVQPVLDRNCIRCHNDTTTFRGKPVFSLLNEPMKTKWTSKMSGHVNGRDGGKFSEAYRNLHRYVRHPGIESDMHMLAPMEFHADSTELVQILRKGHFGVKLSAEDWDRLVAWIDMNTPFHGEWSGIVGEKAKTAEGVRADMRKRYANVEENHEEIPAVASAPAVTPLAIVPEPKPGPTVAAPPVTAHKLRREELDLGGGVHVGMVHVPKGAFVMGSATGHPDERPAHLVQVKQGFWMSETEISNAQFARFDADHNSRRESKQGYQFGVKGYPLNTPGQPAVRLSWQQAKAFCRWLGKELDTAVDLPTEAQWEYACRAGTQTPFSFGQPGTDFAPFANFADA
ncbi:MAG: SUMF1/EgtB/PvdO family nonheme iron enzyme, partial [Victivallales bacterium]|nr:SUMF1/EgtB/PvdO family nonheme iron enzyme [Victivallales bacterium]